MYNPLVVRLDNNKLDLTKFNKKVVFSPIINQPLFSNGFHYFIHRTKDAMSITNKLDTKDKFYLIVSPFEHKTLDWKNDLTNITKKYFKLSKDDPRILSRAFYKMWEILFYFDLGKEKNFVHAALAEGPGAFIQAVINYRQQFGLDEKKDKSFGVTIHPEKGNYIEMGKQFMSYYDEKYPGLVNIHKTYTKTASAKYKSKDNGDITNVKTISNFKKDIKKNKKYANLVTADGGFNWENENYQEQEAYRLILGQIVAALRVQAKGGTFVLKLFETFTDLTIKMIMIVSSFYNESYIFKPFFSRSSNSERYLVVKGFMYDQSKDKKYLESQLSILEEILTNMNTNMFTMDIFEDMEIPSNLKNQFKFTNIKIANTQQIMINKIVLYIKGNNYFGEDFHNYKDEQMKAVDWWINSFYPDKKGYKEVLQKNVKELDRVLNYNKKEIENFSKTLISTSSN
tara:strand:+ start:671 stop:2035 length:1365 start_codon:yes stop_codon:yes gene_type:complete